MVFFIIPHHLGHLVLKMQFLLCQFLSLQVLLRRQIDLFVHFYKLHVKVVVLITHSSELFVFLRQLCHDLLFFHQCFLLFLYDFDRHLHSFVGVVSCISWLTYDLVNNIHAGHYLAKHGILPVKERGVLHTDEKLGTGTVRIS